MLKELLKKISAYEETKKEKEERHIVWRTPVGAPYCKQYLDMLKAPHLLIAGSTGSGKSTVLNGILLSAINTSLPTETQFILIDPKRVELSQYKNLPHTYKFVPTAKEADEELAHVIRYMDKIYADMEAAGIRQAENGHLYVVIDELASILLTPYAKSIKASLQDILQRGRAANVHVIACTQSPSRKTLPAELVLNFTNRIALHCVSAIESKQILNQKGAEDIPARSGKALYMNYYGDIIELNGIPFYNDAEIAEQVGFWVKQSNRTSASPAGSSASRYDSRLPLHR